MSIAVKRFGTTADGKEVDIITMTNAVDSECSLIQYGAAIQSLRISAGGAKTDVALGFDELSQYESLSNPSHGAVIGRHANRVENAEFELNGKTYRLFANEGKNNLHSAPASFVHAVWSYEIVEDGEEPSVRFTYFSPDGEAGFPGNVNCSATYTLSKSNALSLEYDAVSDADTVINLTNHVYLNLAGCGDILGHELRLESDAYTPVNAGLVPDGRIYPVEGTPFDFRSFKPIGRDINEDDEQLHFGLGYDHNFALRGETGTLRPCAELREPRSGRKMTVSTTLPGLQLYTGNQIPTCVGKGGKDMGRFSGLCLETQFFPNALRCKEFKSPIFKAGEHFKHQTVYTFE